MLDKCAKQITGLKVRELACRAFHTILIDSNFNVWSFGNNDKGQLGLAHYGNQTQPILILDLKGYIVSCGLDYTLIIDSNQNIWWLAIMRMKN